MNKIAKKGTNTAKWNNMVKNGHRAVQIGDTKLAEATLEQYAMALRSAEGDSFREIAIRAFFDGFLYKTSEHSSVTGYSHNKLQWVQKDFWEKAGFTLVLETDYGWTDMVPPKCMDMEIALKEKISIYSTVSLFYKHKKSNDRVVVVISKNHHNNSFRYEVCYTGSDDFFKKWVELADQNNFYKGKKIDADCRFLDLKNASWEDVILNENQKRVIQENITGLFSHNEVYKEFGIPIKRGIILHGPPGTGKTMCCKALAGQSQGYSVLYVLPRDFNPQLGGVARIANMAQDLAPCLLIIEDIDFIARDRELGNAGMVIELMNYLDGLEDFGDIVTFGTTNHLDIIEDAIKNRPGRFDRLIEIGKPELPEREAMIRLFTSRYVIQEDIGILSKKIGTKMSALTGSHIKDVCVTAAAAAARSGSIIENNGERKLLIKREHFKEAIAEVSNKNYASYFEMQTKNSGAGVGFNQSKQKGLLTVGDDDDF